VAANLFIFSTDKQIIEKTKKILISNDTSPIFTAANTIAKYMIESNASLSEATENVKRSPGLVSMIGSLLT
jgi:hypothetical protein